MTKRLEKRIIFKDSFLKQFLKKYINVLYNKNNEFSKQVF